MLKTLRVTSFVTVILASIGVVSIVVLGLKGDPEISDFLSKAGIVDKLRGQAGQEGTEEDKSSPLVDLAKAVALRFDPPPPPKPVVKDKPPAELARSKPKPKTPVTPKVQTSAKFDLLATVVYETAPERSLALLKTTANKQEWFRQGEKAGHLEIQEIRDGSVVFAQEGQQPEEMFVPAKPLVQPLLKGEQEVSADVPGSITGRMPGADVPSVSKRVEPQTTDSGTVRMVRPVRSDVATRIQRVRSIPSQAPPKEEKEKLDETISGIEDIMNRKNDELSEEERKKENEMWMELLKNLSAEKKELEGAVDAEEPSDKDVKK